jgi:hypothetical protein
MGSKPRLVIIFGFGALLRNALREKTDRGGVKRERGGVSL